MTILLTGSTGFIGNYFVNHYQGRYNIQPFSFLNDKLNTIDWQGIDIVIHLAALVHQMNGADKDEYERVNVTQTVELAKQAKNAGLGRFLFMSSVKVYGEETDIPYSETSDCNPEDDYGKSKLKAERKLLELEDDTFSVSIIRTPVVYGYGVKANINNFVNLIKKSPILPFGSINNKRSMVYIGNLCHLVDEVILQKQHGIFLAADDEPLSTTELVRIIAKKLKKKVYLLKIPFLEFLLKTIKPLFYKRLYQSLEIDNHFTKKKLNLSNPYSAEKGIERMLYGKI